VGLLFIPFSFINRQDVYKHNIKCFLFLVIGSFWVHIKHASAHIGTSAHNATSYSSLRWRRCDWISWNCWHWV